MIQGYPLASVSNRLKIWSPRPKHKQANTYSRHKLGSMFFALNTLLKLVKFINQACTSCYLTYPAYKIRNFLDKDDI